MERSQKESNSDRITTVTFREYPCALRSQNIHSEILSKNAHASKSIALKFHKEHEPMTYRGLMLHGFPLFTENGYWFLWNGKVWSINISYSCPYFSSILTSRFGKKKEFVAVNFPRRNIYTPRKSATYGLLLAAGWRDFSSWSYDLMVFENVSRRKEWIS